MRCFSTFISDFFEELFYPLFLYLPYCGDTFAFYVWCYSDIHEPFPGGAKKTQKVHFRQKFTFPFKCFYDFLDACEMFWKPPRTARDHNLRVKVTTKFFSNFLKFFKKYDFYRFFSFFPGNFIYPPRQWQQLYTRDNLSRL